MMGLIDRILEDATFGAYKGKVQVNGYQDNLPAVTGESSPLPLEFSKANRKTREQKEVVAQTKKKQAELEGEGLAALQAMYADMKTRHMSQAMFLEFVENILAIRDSAKTPEVSAIMELITERQIHDAANHALNTQWDSADRMRESLARREDPPKGRI